MGRSPRGPYEVALRDEEGWPVVVRNGPVLDDGTPMPTMYWLVGKAHRLAVDRLESAGGVALAERAADATELVAAHRRYAAERDALVPPGWAGPRPSGGVGGTHRGVKCLHAHFAWWLVGGDDPVGRWVAEQLGRSQTRRPGGLGDPEPAPKRWARPSRNGAGGRLAAVDCGSLSTRLLISSPTGEPVVRRARLTGLAVGVDGGGRLSPGPVERALAVLHQYRRLIDRHGAQVVAMVGTSALRDASNREAFAGPAEAVMGVPLRLLTGTEEGALSYAGATAALPQLGAPWLVVDIGGGSLELIAGEADLEVVSIDAGSVRTTERFFHHDPPEAAELSAAQDWLGHELRRRAPCASGRARTLVGLAGTVSALARYGTATASRERPSVHGQILRREAVERAFTELSRMPVAARRQMGGLEPGRLPYIVGGALLLLGVMRHFGFEDCIVCEADLLDGLVRSLVPPVRRKGGDR